MDPVVPPAAPVLLALLIADDVVRGANRKYQVTGIFDHAWVDAVGPETLIDVRLYFRFRGAAGRHVTEVSVAGPTGELGRYRLGDLVANDGGIVEGGVRIAELPVPAFGPYDVSLFVGGEVVGTAVLLVRQRETLRLVGDEAEEDGASFEETRHPDGRQDATIRSRCARLGTKAPPPKVGECA